MSNLFYMIWEKIFGRANSKNEPDIRFGRYSDAYKSDEQYAAWDKAVAAFEKQQYVESYQAFFDYLRDEGEDNVSYVVEDGVIHFSVIQGSKEIKGTASNERVVCETDIATYDRLIVAVMRKLVEINYGLHYSRFAIHDKTICLKFDTSVLDGSPEKLYFALKEVATQADKQDDLLVSEFSSLKLMGNDHVVELPIEEKKNKYAFLQKWIKDAFLRIESLDANKHTASIAYTLLSLTYRIDYLLAPEGSLMDRLEKIHKEYFGNLEDSPVRKNEKIQKIFRDILSEEEDLILRDLYRIKSTFGITAPTAPIQIATLINNEITSINAYLESKQDNIAVSILEYIAQYSMFYYGIPQATRALFHLLIRTIHSDYFTALGYSEVYYNADTNTFNTKAIRKKINAINKDAIGRFPHFKVYTNQLKYTSLVDFLVSLLRQIQQLKYDRQPL
ncbi:MAG: hypothetical protein R3E32_03380 [Chitinophagales bacterium]